MTAATYHLHTFLAAVTESAGTLDDEAGRGISTPGLRF